ncbi:hypothetical protein TB1_004771 [Malus domestica]
MSRLIIRLCFHIRLVRVASLLVCRLLTTFVLSVETTFLSGLGFSVSVIFFHVADVHGGQRMSDFWIAMVHGGRKETISCAKNGKDENKNDDQGKAR